MCCVINKFVEADRVWYQRTERISVVVVVMKSDETIDDGADDDDIDKPMINDNNIVMDEYTSTV